MTTTITHTVKPGGGGDYTSLAAWQAAQNRDLVTADECEVVECYPGTDTTALIITGWTTDSSHTITIKAADTARHKGVFSPTDCYALDLSASTSALCFTLSNITTIYITIDGLQFACAKNAGCCYWAGVAGRQIIKNCIIKGNLAWTSSSKTALSLQNMPSDTVIFIINNIIYNCAVTNGGAIGVWNYTNGVFILYNNTIADCINFICSNVSSAKVLLKNNIASLTGSFVNGTVVSTGSTNNVSNLSSIPGSNTKTGSVSFVDADNDNYLISASDTVAKGYGMNLSADYIFPLTTDCLGQRRAGTWSCGAHDPSGTSADETSVWVWDGSTWHPASEIAVVTV